MSTHTPVMSCVDSVKGGCGVHFGLGESELLFCTFWHPPGQVECVPLKVAGLLEAFWTLYMVRVSWFCVASGERLMNEKTNQKWIKEECLVCGGNISRSPKRSKTKRKSTSCVVEEGAPTFAYACKEG